MIDRGELIRREQERRRQERRKQEHATETSDSPGQADAPQRSTEGSQAGHDLKSSDFVLSGNLVPSLFVFLHEHEDSLDDSCRMVLEHLRRYLYERYSIAELENLEAGRVQHLGFDDRRQQ